MATPVDSARYYPLAAQVLGAPTNRAKFLGSRNCSSLLQPLDHPVPPDVNRNMNPAALPFQPGDKRYRLESSLSSSPNVDAPQNDTSYPGPPDGYMMQMPTNVDYSTCLQYGGYEYQPSLHESAPSFIPPYQQVDSNPSYPLRNRQPLPYINPHHAYRNMALQSRTKFTFCGTNEQLQMSVSSVKATELKAAADSVVKQKEAPKEPKKGRYGDTKIMLPAPQPTLEYLNRANGQPLINDFPQHLLVILDLNGTLLYRPNRNAKTRIERPFLKPFLRFLFQNFSVMVWSSAKPDNVKSLVMQSLDQDLQSKLVARWARDSFKLSPANYNQNVQVYKNLDLVWNTDAIQQHHPRYMANERFGPHNTVLIDDSAIKASAQPYNLIEISEFTATAKQMKGDVLREVAGYLENLGRHVDVSRFIQKQPFKDDGRWSFQWPGETNDGSEGEMKSLKREE